MYTQKPVSQIFILAKANKKARLFLVVIGLALLLSGCSGVTPGPPTPTPPGPPQKIEIPAGFDKAYFEEICFQQNLAHLVI